MIMAVFRLPKERPKYSDREPEELLPPDVADKYLWDGFVIKDGKKIAQ